MRYTKIDPNSQLVEEHFKKLQEESNKILQWSKDQKK